MVSNSADQVTVVLGDEFDDELRARLMDVLRQLGATPLTSASKFIAGSQEMEELDVHVEGCLIHMEAETYVGLSVTGPENIVRNIQKLIE